MFVCCACGSGSPTHITATEGTTAFTGVEAFSAAHHATVLSSGGPSYPVAVLDVLVSSAPGICDRVAAKTIKATTTDVQVSVSRSAVDAIPAGTYSIGYLWSGDQITTALITAVSIDSSCQLSPHPSFARSGTVTLSRISAGEVSGTIDVTLDDGAKLVGSFSAPHCTAAETPPALGDPPWACVQ
jgi:hypothetical protein